MKILQEKYPYGSFKGQKSDGRYINEYLYENLKVMADKITKDMTFLGVCFSSTLEVGTGKSVFCTQMGEAWTDIINKMYGLNLEFTEKNLIWKPKELIERAFQVPKYSFLLLDEWEDASYWSELSMTLRQFFRKCRQLNLFIMVIIPNWFQFPLSYAVSRSVFAIDVKFEDGFQRGFFDFYDFESKKYLYIKGKKYHHYKCQRATFHGRFTDGYGLPEKEYRAAKLKDMMEYDHKKKAPINETSIKVKLFRQIREKLPNIPQKQLSLGFGISERTGCRWVSPEFDAKVLPPASDDALVTTYNKLSNEKEIVWDEDEMVDEKEKEPVKI